MRPGRSESSTGLRSPVPYLLGGIGVIVFLITLALIILTCTKRNPSDTSSTSPSETAGKLPVNAGVLDIEPKIVVIMAGDEKPTFLARPFSLDHNKDSTP
ncbi:Protein GLUTAMINE DUMPER 4 [Dendrobium catenatum]|uniref:Protein GLUTAMINE DUMPER 4 n=1 Tax=Dendrobium catenatum TaxID=906689 RepID=A0A2I0WSN0_9ASPA|nr:Protein GLUTAMINE DUMPER 4 [Dendrobium catenatum]